jgi:hypothetical protein
MLPSVKTIIFNSQEKSTLGKFIPELNFNSRPYYRGRLFIVPVILFAIVYTIPKCFELRLQETNAGIQVLSNYEA